VITHRKPLSTDSQNLTPFQSYIKEAEETKEELDFEQEDKEEKLRLYVIDPQKIPSWF
jgi:hypothetical protein